MPGTATQAYNARVVIDGYDVSNLLRNFEITPNRADVDVTTFDTDGYTESLPTLNSCRATGDILRKGTLASHQNLVNSLLGSDTNIVAHMPDGAEIGKDAYVMESYETENTLGAPVAGVVGGQISFMNSGKYYIGKVIHSQSGTTEFTGFL